jgi:hypothetical protein
VQRHLAGDVWQPLHQEVGCSHASLDRAEGVLNRRVRMAYVSTPRPRRKLCASPNRSALTSATPTHSLIARSRRQRNSLDEAFVIGTRHAMARRKAPTVDVTAGRFFAISPASIPARQLFRFSAAARKAPAPLP